MHAGALSRAGLTPSEYPALQDSYNNIQQQTTIVKALKNPNRLQPPRKPRKIEIKHDQSTFTSATVRFGESGYMQEWKDCEISTNCHGCESQCGTFHKLEPKMESDLTGKIMDGIHDANIQDRECNCNALSLMENGKCMF